MDIAALVSQMSENLSEIHSTVSKLSSNEHNSTLDELERQRDDAIASLQSEFEREQQGLEDHRQRQREEIERQRRKEDEEREARRRREDEELKEANSREDSERQGRLDDKTQQVEEDMEIAFGRVEAEAQRAMDEGQRRLAELEAKRREINRLLDEQLKMPFQNLQPRPRSKGRKAAKAKLSTPAVESTATDNTTSSQGQRDIKAGEELKRTEKQFPRNDLEASTMSSQEPEEPLPPAIAERLHDDIANEPTPVLEKAPATSSPLQNESTIPETGLEKQAQSETQELDQSEDVKAFKEISEQVSDASSPENQETPHLPSADMDEVEAPSSHQADDFAKASTEVQSRAWWNDDYKFSNELLREDTILQDRKGTWSGTDSLEETPAVSPQVREEQENHQVEIGRSVDDAPPSDEVAQDTTEPVPEPFDTPLPSARLRSPVHLEEHHHDNEVEVLSPGYQVMHGPQLSLQDELGKEGMGSFGEENPFGDDDSDYEDMNETTLGEQNTVEQVVEHQADEDRDGPRSSVLTPRAAPSGFEHPFPEDQLRGPAPLQATSHFDEHPLEESDFTPRNVTHLSWKNRERGDSIAPSLQSQSTLSSPPSSPDRASISHYIQDPMMRDLWSETRGRITTRVRNDSEVTHPNDYDASFRGYEETKSMPPPQMLYTQTIDTKRSSSVSNAGALFQKMRNVFENKAAVADADDTPASPAKTRPTSSIFNPIAKARSSLDMRDRDSRGSYSYLDNSEDYADERSSLMRGPDEVGAN